MGRFESLCKLSYSMLTIFLWRKHYCYLCFSDEEPRFREVDGSGMETQVFLTLEAAHAPKLFVLVFYRSCNNYQRLSGLKQHKVLSYHSRGQKFNTSLTGLK